MITALILDLDYTIFTPKSIHPNVIKPFFDTLKETNDVLTKEDLDKAIEEIHYKPFNQVADYFGFSDLMITKSQSIFDNINLTFLKLLIVIIRILKSFR